MNASLTDPQLRDPLLRRVADADPAPRLDLTAAEAARAQALLSRLEATPRGVAAAAEPRRRRLPRAKARLAAAGAAVLAVVAAAVLAPSTASADVVLLQAADAAALQPQATGEYWYLRWQVQDQIPVGAAGAATPMTYQREDWLSRERGVARDEVSGAFRAVEAGTTTINPDDVRVSDYGLDEDGHPAVPTFGGLTWDEVDALPTEQVALRAALLDATPDSGHGRDYDLWDITSQLLLGSPAEPTLRRALWQVLAGIPEVRLLGSETDAVGREGTAVEARFADWYVIVLVLDPRTGALLERRSTLPDGTWPLVSTLVEQGPRDSAPEPQPPLCGPGSDPYMSC
ncbi:CU044_5270 family protein [Xylanimonas ulmi]|uniref:CU044_5270 family protein n=1 Tax=Xylanimonas ulmi TaxID=228973 RepID=A0A4Q7M8A9_9MICO|nr:CU044_5270 family protein [Xylanibacterium ulmi]RZS62938.1 hypothetical protein EV386_3294 [Xylanibacterium ulmi]